MKRLLEPKVRILFLAIGGLVALALLSVALRDLTFQPPVPFSFDFSGFFAQGNPGPGLVIPAWRYFLFAGLLFLILAIIMFFLDPELRKNILRRLLRIALAVLMTWYLITYFYNRGSLQQLFRLIPPAAGAGTAQTNPASALVYTQPQINPWLVFAVSFAIGLALVLIGWIIYTRRLQPHARQAMDQVADIAQDALNDLGPGRNWDDAIVRAYIRMNEVVVTERGLIRQPGSTPREFAHRMERIGLPGEAVRALTNLFETVRYGGKTSSPADRDLAASALSAIVHYCERKS